MSDALKTLKVPAELHRQVRVLAAHRNETILTTSQAVVERGILALGKPSKKGSK